MIITINNKNLWIFSLQIYSKIKLLSLKLQDKYSVDINILILIFYLEKQNLIPKSIIDLESSVSLWRENIIIPLRYARRTLNHILPRFLSTFYHALIFLVLI